MKPPRYGKRVVHFSDLHIRGDLEYGNEVVERINRIAPDVVFFTGDLVEGFKRTHLPEALEVIRKIKVPVYGVSGNHDPQDFQSIHDYKEAFRATGGDFLVGESINLGWTTIHGTEDSLQFEQDPTKRKILLCHYPDVGNTTLKQPYDLVLSGHSHGGQIRIPGWGALVTPGGVGKYEAGFYQAPIGNLYVNRGIGTFLLPVRFCCRPEITILEI